MNRLDVVPWSTAPTKSAICIPSLVDRVVSWASRPVVAQASSTPGPCSGGLAEASCAAVAISSSSPVMQAMRIAVDVAFPAIGGLRRAAQGIRDAGATVDRLAEGVERRPQGIEHGFLPAVGLPALLDALVRGVEGREDVAGVEGVLTLDRF